MSRRAHVRLPSPLVYPLILPTSHLSNPLSHPPCLRMSLLAVDQACGYLSTLSYLPLTPLTSHPHPSRLSPHSPPLSHAPHFPSFFLRASLLAVDQACAYLACASHAALLTFFELNASNRQAACVPLLATIGASALLGLYAFLSGAFNATPKARI